MRLKGGRPNEPCCGTIGGLAKTNGSPLLPLSLFPCRRSSSGDSRTENRFRRSSKGDSRTGFLGVVTGDSKIDISFILLWFLVGVSVTRTPIRGGLLRGDSNGLNGSCSAAPSCTAVTGSGTGSKSFVPDEEVGVAVTRFTFFLTGESCWAND